MEFLAAACSDKGIKKQTNQDALCIKIAETDFGKVSMAVVCDGIGGLSKGELASAAVVRAFARWFDNDFPSLLYNDFNAEALKNQWEQLIIEQNTELLNYGINDELKMGTTVTALLIVKNTFYAMHVGDCRLYEISDAVYQLTSDHTYIAQEIRLGNLTPEEAKVHPYRNALLQCVGATVTVNPDFVFGEAKNNITYMLCSDGFRHKLSNDEIYQFFNADVLLSQEISQQKVYESVELNKARYEDDNISVAILRAY